MVSGAIGRARSPDFGNLEACVEDARRAVLDGDEGPSDPVDYDAMLARLEASRDSLPAIYRDEVYEPFLTRLHALGESDFSQILLADRERERQAGLMLDIAHAILQNGEGYQQLATDSFQEIVSDLYDGFLSDADRRGVKPPDQGVLPPLVKWGNPDAGPYTWPISATASFGLGAAVVSLPPANAHSGLMAWGALGHETAGHDILHADTGLHEELANSVYISLREAGQNVRLARYWSERIDETASDVLGILNMGPAAGIALICYFRGIRAASSRGMPRLSNIGPASHPHPADILRAFLAASTVRMLSFAGADDWANAIEAEAESDLSRVVLAGNHVEAQLARTSASIVAETIVRTEMVSLENHALGEFQDWRDEDEEIVQALRPMLCASSALPDHIETGIYAAHAVSAAIVEGLSGGSNLQLVHKRMRCLLKTMHDANPSWGPLFVAHPGDLVRHPVYRSIPPAGSRTQGAYPRLAVEA